MNVNTPWYTCSSKPVKRDRRVYSLQHKTQLNNVWLRELATQWISFQTLSLNNCSVFFIRYPFSVSDTQVLADSISIFSPASARVSTITTIK